MVLMLPICLDKVQHNRRNLAPDVFAGVLMKHGEKKTNSMRVK